METFTQINESTLIGKTILNYEAIKVKIRCRSYNIKWFPLGKEHTSNYDAIKAKIGCMS